jgi:ATP adenylyltransferase/5',5'''-P-1,P-4-tetraphosphate phosphorylase II
MVNYTKRVDELFSAQLRDWELARLNYGLLSKVKTRAIDFDGFRIFVQFNPERIRSSSAKVDKKSIEARPCFLCEKNRPSEQTGVPFGKDMTILVNPFPIFSRHLTIPTEKHIDQRIAGSFARMLDLAEAIPECVIFYNGPQCGASAPDHLHFQAGKTGFLPIEKDFEERKLVRLISKSNLIEIWHWVNYLRGIVTIKGSSKKAIIDSFNSFFEKFYSTQPDKPEPMLNILAYYNISEWIIHLIPRKIHRPYQFFAGGEKQILLSPASVDLGGVIITPREEDFNKITASDIKDIFSQVCIDENEVLSFFR